MAARRSIKLGLSAALAMALGVAGCGSNRSSGSTAGNRLRVATTVAPITSIAANIAGDLAEVAGVVPEGTNSHTFEPTPEVAKTLARADLVFVNGLKLEDPTKELASENLKEGAEIVELGTATITPDEYIYDFSFPKDGGKPNPHLWTNPPMAKQYARLIADALKRRDVDNAAAYERNYEKFASKVDELDAAMKSASASMTPSQRQLLTYHDAYAYFAEHYGWTVLGAIQVSNFEDPTPKEVADLIDQIRDVKVAAIFGSEVFPSPVLRQIGNETGVKYVDVLRDDDLPGEVGDPEHSWLGLMRFDFITMVESLGGDASALRAVAVENAVLDTAKYPQ
jgi:ABC-type Zn uptake system ZnuABC Zn-binding protein ZnuA